MFTQALQEGSLPPTDDIFAMLVAEICELIENPDREVDHFDLISDK